MTLPFSKRIYTLRAFREDVNQVVARQGDFYSAVRGGRISKAFAEKIMLAVTGVNGCRYCRYGHSRVALAAGVSEIELKEILAGDFNNILPEEAGALVFAQHYAETASEPDVASWQRLVEYYGPEMSRDIEMYLRMITIGNLYGNTFDAFLYRLVGKPAPGSSLLNELGVLLGIFVLLPFEFLVHGWKLASENIEICLRKEKHV